MMKDPITAAGPTGWRRFNREYGIRDAGCRIRDGGCQIPDAGYWILDTRYWIGDIQRLE